MSRALTGLEMEDIIMWLFICAALLAVLGHSTPSSP
jgi:hypothetical protein